MPGPDAAAAMPLRQLNRGDLKLSALGFGAAPLGNLYQPVAEADARATLEAALEMGATYVDTAPYYGFGLSERRVGDVLRERQGWTLSSKVGRLLRPLPAPSGDAERHGFRSPMPFEPLYDYTYDGVLRSYEDSLQRLGLTRIDILYVHDIGALTHGDRHAETFHQLTAGGGFRALEDLRASRAITAFGLGVNECEVCLQAIEHVDLDVILLAGRYTLLEQGALDDLLPQCARRGISIVIGGPFNSGILATGAKAGGPIRYDYAPAPASVIQRVARIEAICEAHGAPLAAAALQFPLAHPSVVSVIPGMDRPARVREAVDLYHTPIPADVWDELRQQGLIRPDAPVPAP